MNRYHLTPETDQRHDLAGAYNELSETRRGLKRTEISEGVYHATERKQALTSPLKSQDRQLHASLRGGELYKAIKQTNNFHGEGKKHRRAKRIYRYQIPTDTENKPVIGGQLICNTANEQKAQRVALQYGYDLLTSPHRYRGNVEAYNAYRKSGSEIRNVGGFELYDTRTLLIDIDQKWTEIEQKLREALKQLDQVSYEVHESSRGKVHLYFYLSNNYSLQEERQRREFDNLLSDIAEYLLKYGVEADRSMSCKKLVYVEGFRVISKGGGASKSIIRHTTPSMNFSQLRDLIGKLNGKRRRATSRRAIMHKIKSLKVGERYSQADLARSWAVSQANISRALSDLREHWAIDIEVSEGNKGGFTITAMRDDRMDLVIQTTFTRKQAFINAMYRFRATLSHYLSTIQSYIGKIVFFDSPVPSSEGMGKPQRVEGGSEGMRSPPSHRVDYTTASAGRIRAGQRYGLLMRWGVWTWKQGGMTPEDLRIWARDVRLNRMDDLATFSQKEAERVAEWIIRSVGRGEASCAKHS